MRIGITSHNYPPHLGGLETIVRELARGFARDHEVIVVSTAWEGRSGIAVEDGAVVHRLPAWHGTERFGVPYATPIGSGTRRAMRALRTCDVLHAHGSLYLTTLLALGAQRKGIPLFITEHVGFVPYSSAAINGVQRLAWTLVGTPAIRRSTEVIAYNTRVRDWIAARFGEDSVRLIPNGVDTQMFRPRSSVERSAARVRLGLPADGVLALFVGRDAQKKNLDAVLRLGGANYQLVVCGAERKVQAGELHLGAVAHSTMPDVFSAADFLVHAATAEGFPVTVQEAMASGLPVVLLWDTGYSGSVERGALMAVDSISELGRAADALATSPALREEISRRSREFAERNWSWALAVDRHLKLFEAASGRNR
jgi:glycosyltransferase involved in cell wall biosynthesis